MNRDTVQTAALVVLMVLALVGYRKLRDAGAASIPDDRSPPPSPPPDRGRRPAQPDDSANR
jgi:hypothetical protein